MKLFELCDAISIDSDIIDVYVWDESKEDYSFCFGCDTGSGDFGMDLERMSIGDPEIKECMSYEVRWIGAEVEDGKPVLRIEVEEKNTEKIEPFYTVEMYDDEEETHCWASYETEENARAELYRMNGKFTDEDGKEWKLRVIEDY